jgi:hypothetical protein
LIADEALRWAMTAVLLAATLYSGFRASRKSALAVRVDHGLHAVMMAAMILMLAPGVQWPVLPQILVFVLAAWWFLIQAASAQPARSGEPAFAGRGLPLYDALSMAAMAYMIVAMDLRGGHGAGTEAAGIQGQAEHHGGATVALPMPASGQEWSGQPATVFAVAFGLAGVFWAARVLRQLRLGSAVLPGSPAPGFPDRRPPPGLLSVRRYSAGRAPESGDALLGLIGAVSMAAMFTVLAA